MCDALLCIVISPWSVTSNRSYSEWGEIFGDPVIATAILDRILHHSITLNMKGESYRLKSRKKAGDLFGQTHMEVLNR